MGDGAEPKAPRLGDRRLGHRRRIVEEFDSVVTLGGGPADPGPGLFGGRHFAAVPGVAKGEIGE